MRQQRPAGTGLGGCHRRMWVTCIADAMACTDSLSERK